MIYCFCQTLVSELHVFLELVHDCTFDYECDQVELALDAEHGLQDVNILEHDDDT